jgi:hypothetical protein
MGSPEAKRRPKEFKTLKMDEIDLMKGLEKSDTVGGLMFIVLKKK